MAVKVDTNPLSSGGEKDLTSIDGYKKMGFQVVGLGIFFALMTVAKTTVQPTAEGLAAKLPGVETGNTENDGIPVV